MSDYLKVAVITTSTTVETASSILSNNLDVLFENYELGFRGHGGVMRLDFSGRTCRGQATIDEEVATVGDLDRARLQELVARHSWITIDASFGIPGVHRQLNVNLFSYPTFDKERPACAVAWLDAWLYRSVWNDDDELDREAAERLRELIVAMGAHDGIEGFHAARIDAFGEVVTFDIQTLRDSLLQPRPIAELRQGKGLVHGIVTGISDATLSAEEIESVRARWAGAEWFETVNGFLVMNNLVPDEDDDEIDN